MEKTLIKNNVKKDISLILCVIYFSYLIFKIFIQKEIVRTDNSILKIMYFFRIDKLLFCVPIFYYFIKTNRENKYFKVNKKLNITDFITYFALIFYINIFLNLIISFVINIEGQKFIVQRPIYTDIIYAICIAPVLEEIVFRGVIMNDLKKYGYKVAIVINSILFGLIHYNINNTGQYIVLGIIFSYIAYKYSLKYSILLHILCNIPSVISIIFYINRDSYSTEALLSYSGLLVIILFLFLILGLIRKKYKEIFSIFKLNNEDRKNIIKFVKDNALYLLVILVIVIYNLLFNYKLF